MLKRATSIAENSTCKHRHGAIIIKGGSVISVGINRLKNDPNHVPDPKRQAAVHAEVAAIRAARGADLNGATIYVARVNACGEQMMSKPCVNCQAALKKAGIRKVYYTIDRSLELV